MKLYVVRHGQTDQNVLGLVQGDTESDLTEKGIEDAKALQELVASLDIDVVVSSPLRRALDTAKLITNNTKNIIIDERLIERDFGLSEGKPVDEELTIKYWNFKLNTDINQVEKIQDLMFRITEFIEDMRNKYDDKKVLVVAHSAILRAIHYAINGIPEDGDLLKIEIPNLRIIEYEI
jgi:broad specificity phosphatase PhoE